MCDFEHMNKTILNYLNIYSFIYSYRAEKRAAWRQARLKSLEQDSLQAQMMIQSMQHNSIGEGFLHKKRKNETLEENDGQDELVSLHYT